MLKFKAKKYYITTAIAYPNSTPHLGHALEIIQSDIIARFCRLTGKDVWLQTGTDEHGVKNWQTAKKEGKDIKDFLDHNVAVFKKLFDTLNISYDFFIRTTDKEIHHPGVIKLWKELVKSGDIYKKNYRGSYCSGCESFKTETELADGKCENHPTREIEIVEEENYFFRLSKYKDEVAKLIESDSYEVVPKVRKNEILSFLKEAKDISFSRPKKSLPWGIPVPDDDSQVMYVWCDALSNYITGVGYGRDDANFAKYWPADIHIIGKDILRFHAAFWPAMLLSAKVLLPKKLFVHGFILSKGTKMGKSSGNAIEPFSQIEKYGVEPFRYYIAGAMPIDGDGEYSEELLLDRINNELVSNIANFCYRTLNFLNKNFEGKVGKIDNNKSLIEEINSKIKDIEKSYNDFKLNEALRDILQISSLGNKYFQDSEPWKLIKEDKEKAHEILSLCTNLVKNLSILLSPILPEFSLKLQQQLDLKDLKWKDLDFKLKNHKIGKDEILIRKIEQKQDSKNIFPINLKVAKIIDVKDHPNADKLYVLQLDLGSEKRQLVAGLRSHYSADELLNKKIIVITNLKYAKLRGVESQGMLLAGDDGTHVGVLTVDKSEPGEPVFVEGYETSDKELTYDDFAKLTITVHNGHPVVFDKELRTDKEIIKAEKVKDGARVR